MSGRGIRDIWATIVSSIERLSSTNCYERINLLASLGFVNRYRRIAARLLPCRGTILDAGCGPGTSTAVLLSTCKGRARIIALDPSTSMLRQAPSAPSCMRLGGRFEKLPLASSSIDGVVAMFSYRDAASYDQALEEFARVLKPWGVLVILDIFRPPGILAKTLLKGYLYGMGRLGGLLTMCPGEGNSYASIMYTIDRMLSIGEMIESMKGLFERVSVYRGPFIAVVWGRKPSSPTG